MEAQQMDVPQTNGPQKSGNRNKCILLSVVAIMVLAIGIVALFTAFSRNEHNHVEYLAEICIVGTWHDSHSGIDGTWLDFCDSGSVTISGVAMSRTEVWHIDKNDADAKQLTITGPSTWTHPGTWGLEFVDNDTLILRRGDSIRVMTRTHDEVIAEYYYAE